jgi:hypothetical protein
MPRFNLCGPTYQSLSPSLDAQFTMNWYLEQDESGDGRSKMAMYPTPGLSLFSNLAGATSVIGMLNYLGTLYAVGQLTANGFNLWQISSTGVATQASTSLVTLPNTNFGPGGLASMFGTPATTTAAQVLIGVTALGVISYFQINPLRLFGTESTQVYSLGEWVDGFVVTLIPPNQFQIFGPQNPFNYNPLNIATVSEFPDNIVSMIENQRMILLFGEKRTVPYYNSGALFPFVPVPGVYVESGCAALRSPVRADNTVFLIGADERGAGIAYRISGYTGDRISTFAVEEVWRGYSTITDAQGYSYQDMGHTFVVWNFPTANATWVYDISNGSWHQRGYWTGGQFNKQLQQVHAYCYGQHFVGDSQSGNIYTQSVANLSDNGNTIRRVRRAPYIAKEHEWVFHNTLEVLAEMGLPTNIPGPSLNANQLNLTAPNGSLWTVTITDGGAITVAAAGLGQVATPGRVVLADNVNETTYWQLQVSNAGALSGLQQFSGLPTKIPPVANYAMASLPSFNDTGLQVNQAGVVNAIPPQAHLQGPQLSLRWSDDGAKTWSNYYTVSLGLTGQYSVRAMWRRLGRSRNRVYEVSCSDAYALRLIDGFINGDPDLKPKQRLSDQMRQVA